MYLETELLPFSVVIQGTPSSPKEAQIHIHTALVEAQAFLNYLKTSSIWGKVLCYCSYWNLKIPDLDLIVRLSVISSWWSALLEYHKQSLKSRYFSFTNFAFSRITITLISHTISCIVLHCIQCHCHRYQPYLASVDL